MSIDWDGCAKYSTALRSTGSRISNLDRDLNAYVCFDWLIHKYFYYTTRFMMEYHDRLFHVTRSNLWTHA